MRANCLSLSFMLIEDYGSWNAGSFAGHDNDDDDDNAAGKSNAAQLA